MTDEQILERLAKIVFPEVPPDVMDLMLFSPEVEWPWNPLERWEDLGPLIEKYRMSIGELITPHGPRWEAACIGQYYTQHESLPHAICLAIIEANSE